MSSNIVERFEDNGYTEGINIETKDETNVLREKHPECEKSCDIVA